MIQLNLQTLRYRGGAVRPDCGNIRFYDSNMNAMYSWLESISNNIATFWLKGATAIPANGAATVFMIPQSYGTTFDGVYAGQAPQLSATYGQYDNGALVFIHYGGGGTAKWSQFTFVGGTWSTSNGYLQQTSTTGSYNGGPAALIESASYANTAQYVIAMAFSYTTEATPRVGLITTATPTSTPDV